jgi:O-antigen ligase
MAICSWAVAVWLVAPNWRERRLDLIGWIAPLVLLAVLLRDRPRSWSHFARLLVLASLPTLTAVFVERALNVGGPFYAPVETKSLLGWLGGSRTYPNAGFFGHSNTLASYLLWIIAVSLGLWWQAHGRAKIAWMAFGLALGAALYFSLARTTIVAAAFTGIVFLALNRLRTRRGLAVLAGGVVITLLIIVFVSRQGIGYALTGRLELWQRALRILARNPSIPLLGYQGLRPGLNAALYVSHNLYALGLFMYGLPGALVMVALALWTAWIGWRAFDRLRERPLAGALWSGMLAFFLVQASISLDLHEAVPRMIFFTMLVAYLGLLDELGQRADGPAPQAAMVH